MNKAELIHSIAEETGMKKSDVEKVLNAFVATVKGTLADSQEVRILGFGTFKVAERSARKGRNPRTGEEMVIPARKVVKFRPGQALQAAVA